MRLAVISDIHGNYKALEAFVEYIERQEAQGNGIAEILLLGDFFTDGPDPKRIMRMLRNLEAKYPCHYVLGNREEYLLGDLLKPQGWKPSSLNGMLYFVAQRLDAEIIDFMKELPIFKKICYEGLPSITICHGSPTDTRSNFMEDPGKHAQCMKALDTDFLIAGHTHRQEVSKLYNKMYLNPGALGMAIDSVGGQAPFAILTGVNGNWEIELKSIPYDIESYLNDFKESGLLATGFVLSRATQKTLLTGVNYFFKTVIEVGRKTGLPSAQIPENIWEEVASELGIE